MALPKRVLKLCAPMYRCFPPLPTICVMCKRTTAEGCPWRKIKDEADES